MSDKGLISIYINIKPRRWRIASSYHALRALERLSAIRHLGFAPGGIHDGIGIHTNFVLHLIFASQEEKEAYEQDSSYHYFLKKLRLYSKRDGFNLITS